MKLSADRNLLFGVLAFRNGIITESQLVSGLRQWTFDKSKSLGEVLVVQEAITQQQLQLLDPMVDAHVRIHNDDPRAALQQLGSSLDVLNTLSRQIEDDDLQRSIDHSTLASLAAGPNSHDSVTIDWIRDGGAGRFRILRPHAQGGLGEVFLAEDSQLHRYRVVA